MKVNHIETSKEITRKLNINKTGSVFLESKINYSDEIPLANQDDLIVESETAQYKLEALIEGLIIKL